MTRLYFTFSGHIPSKKNSLRRISRRIRGKQRTITVPSEAYELWQKNELVDLKAERKRLERVEHLSFPLSPPYRIAAHFYPASLQDFDLSNSLESINDILVDAGFLVDDKQWFLQHLDIRLAGFDSSVEHCKIAIETLPETDFELALKVLKSKTRIKELARIEQTSEAAVKRHWRQILCSSKPSSMLDSSSHLMSMPISNATE